MHYTAGSPVNFVFFEEIGRFCLYFTMVVYEKIFGSINNKNAYKHCVARHLMLVYWCNVMECICEILAGGEGRCNMMECTFEILAGGGEGVNLVKSNL